MIGGAIISAVMMYVGAGGNPLPSSAPTKNPTIPIAARSNPAAAISSEPIFVESAGHGA